jgi:hypothetical protein
MAPLHIHWSATGSTCNPGPYIHVSFHNVLRRPLFRFPCDRPPLRVRYLWEFPIQCSMHCLSIVYILSVCPGQDYWVRWMSTTRLGHRRWKMWSLLLCMANPILLPNSCCCQSEVLHNSCQD